MSAVEQWYESRQPALIAGRMLLPCSHPLLDSILEISRGQGSIYWFDTPDGQMVLKVFHPGMTPEDQYVQDAAICIPQIEPFRCGWERQILTSSDLESTGDSYHSAELANFIDGTILMPVIGGESWGEFLRSISEGRRAILADARLRIASSLSEAVTALELSSASHRDLSCNNVLVSPDSCSIALIDWDTIFHPILPSQSNMPLGTPGYIAPWTHRSADANLNEFADRFSLAICVAEIISIRQGLSLEGDGSLFSQASLGREHERLDHVIHSLESISRELAQMFLQAWHAQSFADCPTAISWLEILSAVGGTESGPSLFPVNLWRNCQEIIQDIFTSTASDEECLAATDLPSIEGVGPVISTEGQKRHFEKQVFKPRRDRKRLRDALWANDTETIVAMTTSVDFSSAGLRLSELAQIEILRSRSELVHLLLSSLNSGQFDIDEVMTRWWDAVRAGCSVPIEVHRTVLQIQRTQERDRTAVYPSSA